MTETLPWFFWVILGLIPATLIGLAAYVQHLKRKDDE